MWGVGVGGGDGGGGGGDDGGATVNDGNDDDIPTARRIDHGVSLITCSCDDQTPTSNYDEQILSLVVKVEPSFRRSLHGDRCLGVEYNYAYPGPAQMLSSLPLGRPRQPATALVTPSFFFKHLGLHHLKHSQRGAGAEVGAWSLEAFSWQQQKSKRDRVWSVTIVPSISLDFVNLDVGTPLGPPS